MTIDRKKDFQQREGICAYCDFEGNIIVFENELGEEVEICGGCLEEALEEIGNYVPRGI